MMESCLSNEADRCKQVEVENLRRNLSAEFSALSRSQHSVPEEREHLKVYLRIRPFTSAEEERGESQDCVAILPPDKVLLKPPRCFLSARLSSDRTLSQTAQRFGFSQVYGPETSQRELFDGTVKDLVRDVLEGGNSLLFTYGVSNAGKTFTFLGPETDPGILPQSLSMIFSNIDQRVFTSMSVKPYQCQESMKLSREQQAEEEVYKRKLLGQIKESEKWNTSQLSSTTKTVLEGSSVLGPAAVSERGIGLDVETHTKFSVWVSFCEIYNENIHDLLEALPSGALRRTALRLSQDVKGNAFVKDLRWVQVNTADEAYKVVKLGKKNQSFSSTRLNQLSSRSHSVFSIRIMRIDDGGAPRVRSVSELCLCDLAGSERCAKTQNNGERLKEAGNINTSLLILGKCINALRSNQQARLLQHVPFRESKLTHYLQGFFSGRGKACMIVNINQCASVYDETVNVLKFSAVAQKVVVLTTKTLPIIPRGCTGLLANASGAADRWTGLGGTRSSPIGWESSLEDVQEEEGSLLEDTVDQSRDEDDDDEVVMNNRPYRDQAARLKELEETLRTERLETLLMEARVREEVGVEFQKLFSDMQTDFTERLEREREIMQERADNRLEIFKKLVEKMAAAGPSRDAEATHSSVSPALADLKVAEAALRDLGSGQAGVKGSGRDDLDRKSLEADEVQRNQRSREDPALKAAGEVTVDSLEPHSQEEAPSALTRRKPEVVASLSEEAREGEGEEASAGLAAEERRRRAALAALEEQGSSEEGARAVLEVEKQLSEAGKKWKEELEALRTKVGELTDKLEVAENRVAHQTARAEQVLVDRQAAQEQLDQCCRTILDKTSHIHTLTEEVQSLKRELQIAAVSSKSLNLLTEEVCELKKSRAVENEKSESKRREILLLEKELAQAEEEFVQRQETLNQQLQQLQEQLKHQEAASKQEVDELNKKVQEQELIPQKQLAELETKLGYKEEELQHLRRQLEEQTQTSEKLTEQLKHQEAASKQEVEELNKKIQEQELIPQKQLAELETKLKYKEEELQHLRRQLEEQTKTSEKQMEELNEKLREQDAASRQHLEELKNKLSEQKTASEQLLKDLGQQLTEQKQTSDLLKTHLEEAKLQGVTNRTSGEAERLRRMTADLQAQVSSLKEKLDSTDEKNINPTAPEVEDSSSPPLSNRVADMEQMLKDNETKLAEREATLQKNLSEKEAQVASLQKRLKEAREKRDIEEMQAVQETRRREVEHRRELLAVAHEAIAQKDAELEKRVEEIGRLKERAEQDSTTVKNLGLELQRKGDDASDLKDKLADYKKQIQQVEKKISAMRDDEKTLRQKLGDLEKTKKQLQADVTSRDRTIQQLRTEQQSDAKTERTLQLHQQACKDGEAKDRVIADMRVALMEQEVTQQEMEQVLEERQNLIQELTSEVENLKGMLRHQQREKDPLRQTGADSNDAKLAQAQENLKLCKEKSEAERLLWVKEKLSLLGQVKEAEDRRNKEMTAYVKDRKCNAELQSQMRSLSSQLAEKEQTMEKWRTERDTLVAALEVRIKNLWTSLADKDKLIQELRQNSTRPPLEVGGGGAIVAELQAALSDRNNEIQRLKELQALTPEHVDAATQTQSTESPAAEGCQVPGESQRSEGKRCTRVSVSSQGSASCPSVLDSSEISTENGRTSRFPRPEMEISFSPLQPNRMALRRQGEESAVTVKLTRSARKRKSGEMTKTYIFRRRKGQTAHEEDVEAENRKNIGSRLTPKRTPHQDESSSTAGSHDSASRTRSRKEGTLQKIGGFLQSSPTLLGSKAKKMMSLVSSRGEESTASSSSLSLRLRSKKKPYRPEISSPMEVPPHPIINREPEQNESNYETSKKRRRTKTPK